MENRIIYSPNQIGLGSFWGGPIAAVYMLRSNYLVIEKEDYAQKVLSYGFIFTIALLAILPFLPEKFPNMIIPLLYCYSAKQIAESTQLKKDDIENNESNDFASNWKIFGIGTLTLIIFLVIAVIELVVLETMGVITLA
nr:putative integron gene cassette protein [uncultured bacterium]